MTKPLTESISYKAWICRKVMPPGPLSLPGSGAGSQWGSSVMKVDLILIQMRSGSKPVEDCRPARSRTGLAGAPFVK